MAGLGKSRPAPWETTTVVMADCLVQSWWTFVPQGIIGHTVATWPSCGGTAVGTPARMLWMPLLASYLQGKGGAMCPKHLGAFSSWGSLTLFSSGHPSWLPRTSPLRPGGSFDKALHPGQADAGTPQGRLSVYTAACSSARRGSVACRKLS